jgi:hypothetical protein
MTRFECARTQRSVVLAAGAATSLATELSSPSQDPPHHRMSSLALAQRCHSFAVRAQRSSPRARVLSVKAMASSTDAVKAAIASAPVVVFSKTYCPCVCCPLCAGETPLTGRAGCLTYGGDCLSFSPPAHHRHCTAVKGLFSQLNVPVKLVELDVVGASSQSWLSGTRSATWRGRVGLPPHGCLSPSSCPRVSALI